MNGFNEVVRHFLSSVTHSLEKGPSKGHFRTFFILFIIEKADCMMLALQSIFVYRRILIRAQNT